MCQTSLTSYFSFYLDVSFYLTSYFSFYLDVSFYLTSYFSFYLVCQTSLTSYFSLYLVSPKIIGATLAEKALLQYLDLLAAINQQDLEKAKSFNYKDSRLDAFYFDEMLFKMPAQLTSILKLVLILSHGQSSVERGFNVNKDVVKVNLQ